MLKKKCPAPNPPTMLNKLQRKKLGRYTGDTNCPSHRNILSERISGTSGKGKTKLLHGGSVSHQKLRRTDQHVIGDSDRYFNTGYNNPRASEEPPIMVLAVQRNDELKRFY